MQLRRPTFGVAAGLAIAAALWVRGGASSAPEPPKIRILRTPAGGIQPQAVFGSDGVLRMIYFTGDPAAGNIEYVTRAAGAKGFSRPMRVNSQPGSALAIGTVRGPQLAVGRGGRVEVVWFGSKKAEPRGPGGSTPVLFSHLDETGTAFEPQRSVMQYATGVDGGLSVAADSEGDVYAVWHATGSEPGEAHRRVYMARSTDGGRTFAREIPVSPVGLGACGCCGMRAFVDSRGALYILYGAATDGVHRDMTLLASSDRGHSFEARRVGPWLLNACPMSTDFLSEGGERVLAAWEKAGQVYFDEIDPTNLRLSIACEAPGQADDRKHPAVAANSRGQVLLAWTEGTGWAKGGALAWQLFDRSGHPAGAEGHAPGVPVWGMPTAFADQDGNFTVIY